MTREPYSRIYHKLADEYPHVYEDDRALSCFTRLLVQADQSWPTTPYLPASVNRKALALLTGTGLVELEGTRFRIRGHVAERTRRAESAAHAARTRHRTASGNADRTAEIMPRRDKTRREEKEKLTETVEVNEARPPDPVQPKNDGPRCETCGHRKVPLGDGRFVCTTPHRPVVVA